MFKKVNMYMQKTSIPMKNLIGILVSSLIGFVLTLFITLVLSVALKNVPNLPESLTFYFVFPVVFSSLIAGFISSKLCDFKGIFSGCLSSIFFSFLVTIMIVLFTDGYLNSQISILYIGIVLSSMLGGIISANMKKRK